MVTRQLINEKKNCKVWVTFTMPAIDGCNCLYLVGKFDGGNESVYRMKRAEDGTWSLSLELEAGGDYQYRYRTDKGFWLDDPLPKVHVPDYESSEPSALAA